MARRNPAVFGLSFLDAMTCGFGAVILFYMVINAATGLRTGRLTGDLRADADRLEVEVLEGYKNLVELRNSRREVDRQQVAAQGLSRRLIEQLDEITAQLATYEAENLARSEHINRLKSDLQTLEREARRLSAAAPTEETPGDKLRSFVGDGDRQYLTGLKVGGKRILILVDASASMLGDTVVNIIRRRNLPDTVKIRAEKWQQAVSTVDWLTTQIPRQSEFQIYTYNVAARPVLPDSAGRWLPAGNRETLDDAVARLRQVVPAEGTSLYHALHVVDTLRPPPDNVILLCDGLPTSGKDGPQGRTISGKGRVKLFNRAVQELRTGIPVNVILFPLEGDPLAASAYWKIALHTGGAFISPAKDWP